MYNTGAVYIQPFPSTNMPLIKSRNFWLCVNIFCSVPFLLQLFHVLNNFLDPSVTRFLLNFMFSLSLLLSTSPALWWKRRGFKILSSPSSSRSAWCQASTSLQSWRLAMATWGDTVSSGGTHFIELRTYSTEGRAPTTALLLAGQVTPITGRVEMSLRCWKRR